MKSQTLGFRRHCSCRCKSLPFPMLAMLRVLFRHMLVMRWILPVPASAGSNLANNTAARIRMTRASQVAALFLVRADSEVKDKTHHNRHTSTATALQLTRTMQTCKLRLLHL